MKNQRRNKESERWREGGKEGEEMGGEERRRDQMEGGKREGEWERKKRGRDCIFG
jgi:hypothetical protein